MAGDENAFKKALQETPSAAAEGAAGGQAGDNLLKKQQLRTVADLELVPSDVLERMPKVRDLTVRDLNDLAAEFSGVKTDNRRVRELSLEDVQDLESVFFDFKVNTGREAIRSGVDQVSLTSVDVSCCCCTPCCCCAATDMAHTG